MVILMLLPIEKINARYCMYFLVYILVQLTSAVLPSKQNLLLLGRPLLVAEYQTTVKSDQ
jgi:hypothetical protein